MGHFMMGKLGILLSDMEKDLMSMLMVINILVTGMKVKSMAMENLKHTNKFTKDTGLKDWETVKELSLII